MRANTDYLYWDRFKHLKVPEGLSIEDAWRILKIERGLMGRPTPIKDTAGRTFTYSFVDSVQRSLMVIDQQAGGRIGTRVSEFSRETQRAYMFNRLMEEAIASSQIEGAATTRRDAKEMLRTGRKPKDRGERMILNNYRTITRIKDYLSQPLSPEVLLDLQASLTKGTLRNPSEVGRFRTADDHDVVVGSFTGEVFHVPPEATVMREQLLDLCHFASEDAERFIHPVLKAILLHFWLAYLHPFCDGNGRTARAVFYLHSLKAGYRLFEYMSVSRVMLRRRAQYERAFLYSEIDDANLTYFVLFHLRAIETALDEFWKYAERKGREDRELQRSVSTDVGFNYRQRAILARALKDTGAVFTIASHRASHDVAYATARSDLLELAGRGYLRKQKSGRHYSFLPVPDIRDRLRVSDDDGTSTAD